MWIEESPSCTNAQGFLTSTKLTLCTEVPLQGPVEDPQPAVGAQRLKVGTARRSKTLVVTRENNKKGASVQCAYASVQATRYEVCTPLEFIVIVSAITLSAVILAYVLW